MNNADIHPSNLVMIDGAIFEGKYAQLVRRPAWEWMQLYHHDRAASMAILGARDGAETSFPALGTGEYWHLRRAD